jgi:hypothetical protein
MDLKTPSVLELLALHAGIGDELMRRGICRTTNNPVADYTEHLVTNALGLTLAPKSTKGFDATDSGHKRYEIKRKFRRQNPGNLM